MVRSNPNKVVASIPSGGEVTVNLVLTIKLDGEGLKLSTGTQNVEKKKSYLEEEDEVNWIIPDIKQETPIENFGKKE